MIKPEQNPRGPGVLEAPKGLIKGSSAENDLNKISHDPMLNSLTEAPSLAPTPINQNRMLAGPRVQEASSYASG